jgi:surface polysaccharide O-acyltransferase-like enzyme
MSDRADDRWAIARLLFTTHLPFLLLCWAVFAAAVVALTFALDLRVDLDRSVWDPAVSAARWFALGYGVYLVNRLLPVFVAHGRTRREFAASIAVFMVAALLALGVAVTWVMVRDIPLRNRVA